MSTKLVKKENGTLVFEQIYENPKEEIKSNITSTIDINDEIKIIRETLAKVIQFVPAEKMDEFKEYNELIQNIKNGGISQ